MKGMVFAAGLGMRFLPVTSFVPKPLIPLCLRPLVDWAIDSLVEAGVREIVVNLHHLPDPLERFIAERYDGRLTTFFSREEKILGTGGGLAKVSSFFDGENSFYVVNGDTIHMSPLRELERARADLDAIAALLLRPRDPSAPYTGVAFDGERIGAFRDDHDDSWMFAGAHALTPEIFRWIPQSTPSGIVSHAYEPILSDSEETIAGAVWEGAWHDIGTPARYLEATRDILGRMVQGELAVPERGSCQGSSLVHAGSTVKGETLESVVGDRSLVVAGSRVERSVLWNDCRVGEESEISRSILAHGVVLPGGMRVDGALICAAGGFAIPAGGRRLDGHLIAVPIDPDREMTISGG